MSGTDTLEIKESYITSSPLHDMWVRLKRNKLALFGLFLVIALIVIAILASFIAPYDPIQISLKDSLKSPSSAHLMGTDVLGRDIFSRIIYGTRASLIIGVVATSISLIIVVVIGSIAGYYGGWIDSIMMRITDIFFAFPFFSFSYSYHDFSWT